MFMYTANICDYLNKTQHVIAYKLKFILFCQLIATLNNYAYSLPPLASVDWSTFPECLLLTI